MNKLMLASLSLLLAGATAVPAQAQEQGRFDRDDVGDTGLVDGNERSGRDDSAERQESREEVRQEARQDVRQENRQDYRQEVRQENRQAARQDVRRDSRQNYGQIRDDQGYGSTYGGVNDSRHDSRHDNRYDSRHDNRYDSRYDNRYDGGRYDVSRYSRHDDRRWNGNHWYPQYRYRAPVRYVYPRGYRDHQWRVGHRLPSSYYGRDYYVDYNAYRLPPPPYGYHWVRVNRDVVLVSIASGLIRDILYGLYY